MFPLYFFLPSPFPVPAPLAVGAPRPPALRPPGRGASERLLAQVAPLKSMPDRKEIVGWFRYESCIFFQ